MTIAGKLDKAAVKLADKTFTDVLRFTADPQGSGDDVLNEDTLTWDVVTGDVLYEGIGALMSRNREPDDQQLGVATQWQASVPMSVAGIPEGAICECVESRSPELVGRKFRVIEVLGSSLEVSRRYRLEATTPTVREPVWQ